LSPKGEFWNRLERALDLSKNVSEPAKNNFRLEDGLLAVSLTNMMVLLISKLVEAISKPPIRWFEPFVKR
jgi:hypothetical protein